MMPHDQALSNKDVNIYEIVELNVLNWKGGAKFVFTFIFPHQDWNIICVCVLSHVQLFSTPWIVVHQAPLICGISQARMLG